MTTTDASETKSIIRSLLISTPLRCTIKQLCDDFRNIVGFNIPFRKLGFNNEEEYLRSIPDTVRIIGSGPSAEVKDVISEKSAHINLLVAKQRKDNIPAHKRKNVKRLPQTNSTHSAAKAVSKLTACASQLSITEDDYQSKIPKRIQNNLRKLMMRFPNGIWCRQLAAEYRKMFQEELSYEKFHFRSLIEMCTDLSEIFYYIRPNSDDFKLFNRNNTIPCLDQNNISDDSRMHSSSPDINWSLSSDLIPSDIVNFPDVIPQFTVDDIKIGDYLDLAIGEIYDFSQFWVFPKYGDINLILTELKQTLESCKNRYIIPEVFLQVGLYCCVFHKNKYHRGVIIDLLPQNLTQVRILFIDYGSIGDIDCGNIWYLPQKFGAFPCQAIKAKLANISTNGDSAESLNKFKDLITNAEIIAEVVNINKADRRLDLYLANITNENNIFFVNDALVEKGYAQYS